MKFLLLIDKGVDKFCSVMLITSILSLLFFSVLTIFLRWFHVNLMWIDPLARHLVFLATFLGGAVATGRGTHIAIDLVGKILEVKEWHALKVWVGRIINLTCAICLVWLFKAGLDFTKVEFEFAKEEFLKINSGYLVAIIPFGVALISFRFFILFLKSFQSEGVN